MKKTAIKILIIGFVLTFLFPKSGTASIRQSAFLQSSNFVAQSQVSVQVVQAAAFAKIAVAQTTHSLQAAANCSQSSFESASLIQDAGAVNLNEPANCFLLTATILAKTAQANLKVSTAPAITVKVYVSRTPLEISAPNLSQGAMPQSIPALPLTVFLVVVLYELSKKGHFVKEINKKLSAVFSISSSQLQVLRC